MDKIFLVIEMKKACSYYLCVCISALLVMETIHFICDEVKFVKNAKLKALYKIEEATQKMKKKLAE